MDIDMFINELSLYIPAPYVFNPWGPVIDPFLDLPDASKRRKDNLWRYLEQRVPNAKYIFLAEALGYQGGRFSGIAMTSERILAGRYKSISPGVVINGEDAFESLRSSNSNSELRKKIRKRYGFAEPTATTVWTTMTEIGLNLNEVILWNLFPFHPYNIHKGFLSNRSLDIIQDDISTGILFLQRLLLMNHNAQIIAIGGPSRKKLDDSNIPCLSVTHPSMGRTPDFKRQLRGIFQNGVESLS